MSVMSEHAIVKPKTTKKPKATTKTPAIAATGTDTAASTSASTSTADETMFFDVQQKTDKQHILDNPDTYIGSVELIDNMLWVLDNREDATDSKIPIGNFVLKNISYNPGLFKLFDEGLVNCRDHAIRMKGKVDANVPNSLPVTHIDVRIEEDGTITMVNDGNGIDVVRHPEYDTWVPELIFGHLRTSTNYNKDEKKIVGGKNGYGFKLVLIWSTHGTVETVDHIRGLKYKQEFRDNLNVICPPKITQVTNGKPYTKITFKPDYQRLGLTGLTPEMVQLMSKRVYDIAAVTNKSIKVTYNGKTVPVKSFEQYVNMYLRNSTSSVVYESPDERWEYAVAMSPTRDFTQVSFVNGICTHKGGKHVDYIMNQIVTKITKWIETKKKITVSNSSIREQLMLFLRCDIENPAFDSQSKDCMNTPSKKFGSTCVVSDKFVEQVIKKFDIAAVACKITELKDEKMAAKTDGSKKRNVSGILKLDDANWAGTAKSNLCTLVLCEGDSAKTGVISGMSPSDRNIIGVYACRGKLMNVRGETTRKIYENNEIADLKKILGLESGKEYNSMEEVHKCLRYSKVVMLTDQDLDGSHIKGLFINLLHVLWPSLLKLDGFVCTMNTPILKATHAHREPIEFYNEGEYEQWKTSNGGVTKGWNIKYYKGLGTSTKAEWVRYFKTKRFLQFQYTNSSVDDCIDMVFNKSRPNDRKRWLEQYDRTKCLNSSSNTITYDDFIHHNLIHFSKYACDRSIPNMVDGLKISLRKILYSAFKKKLTSEIKVAQFNGYVSEHSAYHHGETSLNNAIIGMAQSFVGSNNINLLVPSGQFGSRIQGGFDASSPRYIFTCLEKITRYIFPEADDAVLTYLTDDGNQVEPMFYVPIIPTILVNGTSGIGTGFSSDVLCYNPRDIIQVLKHKLTSNAPYAELVPYYEGFKGTIQKSSTNNTSYVVKGVYHKVSPNEIRVTELPVGFWTEDFKKLLTKLQDETTMIHKVAENHTDATVDFTITFTDGVLDTLEATSAPHGCNGLEKTLKLYALLSAANMHLFNHEDKLVKYETTSDIIDAYFPIRLHYYELRKSHLVKQLESEQLLLFNRKKYICDLLDGHIDLRNKSKTQVDVLLTERGLTPIDGDFKYLTKMAMDAVTVENVHKMNAELEAKEAELEVTKHTSVETMWLSELDKLEAEYVRFKEARTESLLSEAVNKEAVNKEAPKKRVVKRKTIVDVNK